MDVGKGSSGRSNVMCVECDDMDARVLCNNCADYYCALCFQWQHQRGNRARHTYKELGNAKGANNGAPLEGTTEFFILKQRELSASVPAEDTTMTEPSDSPSYLADHDHEGVDPIGSRARFIPIRIDEEERVLLHLLEGALDVSEYTDKVDVSGMYGFSFASKNSKVQTIADELETMLKYLSGLTMCGNFKAGERLLKQDLEKNLPFYEKIFEVGRRYKICNPQKMRSTYGKMMWLLQDSIQYEIPNFPKCRPLHTVSSFLGERGAGDMLNDPLLTVAAMEVMAAAGISREQIARELDMKKDAVKRLKEKYVSDALSEEELMRIVVSVSDSNNFVASNRYPVDNMLHYLTTLFHPDKIEEGFSLAISYGKGGSKLNHDHRTQFTFVRQSLVLWREIMDNMYRLWMCTESDLLSERNRYSLWNTGQGLNRVQSAPAVGSAMNQILSTVQAEVRGWVGLSVVHLGDRDVPNALVFIDKYLQVPRILAPICKVIEALPQLYEQPQLKRMIDQHFDGLDSLRKIILRDYFRHGFDGSGSDGGSCIDGRLTSSWNWCSLIEKKPFGHIFMLAGFQGFDGDFRK